MLTSSVAPPRRKVPAKTGCSVDDVDLFEVNEAFAVVAMIAALERRGLKQGVAGLCVGGSEATAMVVELI